MLRRQLKRIRGAIAQTREKIQKSLESNSARPRRARGRRRLHHAAQRSLRDSRSRLATAAPFQASFTLRAPRAKPFSSSRSKPSISIIASCSFRKKKPRKSRAFSPSFTEQVRSLRGPLEFAAAEHRASRFGVSRAARFAREFDACMPEFIAGNSIASEARAKSGARRHAAAARPQSRPCIARTRRTSRNGDGHQRAEHRRQDGRAEDGGPRRTRCAVGNSSGRATRASCRFSIAVLADIGDEQSIAADLSTFSAHMLNLKVDARARNGTHTRFSWTRWAPAPRPKKARRSPSRCSKNFARLTSLTLATTHHDRLKAYASTTPGVVNAAMEFDEEQSPPDLSPARRRAGDFERNRNRAAAWIAAQVVIERARARLSPETREARGLIAYLHRSRDEVEEIKREAREELDAARSRTARVPHRMGRPPERSASRNWRSNFARDRRSSLEAEVARLAADIQDRKLRARDRKTSRPPSSEKLQSALATRPMRPSSRRSRLRRRTSASKRQRSAQAGRAQNLLSAGPARFTLAASSSRSCCAAYDGRSAEVEAGPMRMKVPLSRHRRHRSERPVREKDLRPCRASATPRNHAFTRSQAMSPPPKKSTSSAARSKKPLAASTNSSTTPRWRGKPQRAHHSRPRHRRAPPRPRRIFARRIRSSRKSHTRSHRSRRRSHHRRRS